MRDTQLVTHHFYHKHKLTFQIFIDFYNNYTNRDKISAKQNYYRTKTEFSFLGQHFFLQLKTSGRAEKTGLQRNEFNNKERPISNKFIIKSLMRYLFEKTSNFTSLQKELCIDYSDILIIKNFNYILELQ